MQQELLQTVQQRTGIDQKTINCIVNNFLDEIVVELSQGHIVDLGDDFGIFTVKLRIPPQPGKLDRKPRDSRYKVVFREKKNMKSRLKVAAMQLE